MLKKRLSGVALGAAVATLGTLQLAEAQVRVAVVGGGTDRGAQAAAQLNDSSVYAYTATAVAPADVDTDAELSAYDVVVLGNSGNSSQQWTAQMAEAIQARAQSGRLGVVTAGWYNYQVDASPVDAKPTLNAISPLDTSGTYQYCGSWTVTWANAAHPIAQGLGPLNSTLGQWGSIAEFAPAIDVGAESIGTGCSGGLVVTRDGNGYRTVYLGILFMSNEPSYSSSELNQGAADQLFEQTVAWVAAGVNVDTDSDGILDAVDNCPDNSNADQLDTNTDGAGDACDDDDDGDGVLDASDNCALVVNADQLDTNTDDAGDACDDDDDGDGDLDVSDNCPLVSNADQLDTDNDGAGNACSDDDDGDDVADASDNCPLISNADQLDTDGDDSGDACSDDDDGDDVADASDNCPLVDNADQADADDDGAGDACSDDDDSDDVADASDNCPLDSNDDQADADDDGIGDACDTPATSGGGGCSANGGGTPASLLFGVAMVMFVVGRQRKARAHR